MEMTEPRESSGWEETQALTQPGPLRRRVAITNLPLSSTSNLLVLISISQTQLEARGQESPGDTIPWISIPKHQAEHHGGESGAREGNGE